MRFEGNAANDQLATLGRDNPTLVSSETPGHSGHFANDGDPATFWQATEGDKNPWLTLDLERLVRVSTLRVAFPSAAVWRCRAEISEDGQAGWLLVADESGNSREVTTITGTLAQRPRGRFLRVTFTALPPGKPAALAEVAVLGAVASE